MKIYISLISFPLRLLEFKLSRLSWFDEFFLVDQRQQFIIKNELILFR